jgi:hypothetical protein
MSVVPGSNGTTVPASPTSINKTTKVHAKISSMPL